MCKICSTFGNMEANGMVSATPHEDLQPETSGSSFWHPLPQSLLVLQYCPWAHCLNAFKSITPRTLDCEINQYWKHLIAIWRCVPPAQSILWTQNLTGFWPVTFSVMLISDVTSWRLNEDEILFSPMLKSSTPAKCFWSDKTSKNSFKGSESFNINPTSGYTCVFFF